MKKVPVLAWDSTGTPIWHLLLHKLFPGIPYALGEVLPTVIGYFVKDWRMFQLAVSLFMFATCLSWFLLPESPRYLISKGNFVAVTNVLEKAAKKNGVELSPVVMASKKGEGHKKLHAKTWLN